jgi:hypothetical protein
MSDSGKAFYFMIAAVNSIGVGQLSEPWQVVAATVPDMPTSLITLSSTSRTVISFAWSNGISNGGTPVIDYRISYDQGIGIFVVIATGVTSM